MDEFNWVCSVSTTFSDIELVRLFRVKYFQAYKMDTETIRKNLKSIQGTNDYYFMGYPSSLYTYAKLAQENKFDNIQFKGVVSWGDKMFPHYRKMIEKQFNLLKIDKYNLLHGDVLEFLKKECTTQYDLIFIDPPYDGKLLRESLNLLQMYRYFIGCSYLFFEQINDKQNKTNLDFMNRDWIILKDLSIGEVSYTIAKKRE